MVAPFTRTICSNVHITASNLRWSRDGLVGSIKVQNTAGKMLHDGQMNLSDLKDKENLGRFLQRIDAPSAVYGEIGDFCAHVIEQQRQASKPVVLRDVPKQEADPIIDVGGIPILEHHANIFFGDGETFKSLIALHVAGKLAQQGKKVLLCDWEMDAPDHRTRLEGLFGQDMPNVFYEKVRGPIHEHVNQLKEVCAREAINFLVLDSAGFAVGMPPESAEAALSYYGALHEIGVPGSITIAHMTKTVKKVDRGREKPFGSAFWHNGARMTFFFQPLKRDENGAQVVISCRKSNLVKRPDPRQVDLKFTEEGISIKVTTQAVATMPEDEDKDTSAKKTTVGERVRQLLREHGPLTRQALQTYLPDVKDKALQMALKRSKDFTLDDDGRYQAVQ